MTSTTTADINENYYVSDSTIYPNLNTTTGIKQIYNGELRIYPNPATNSINIVGITSKAIIKLYDVLGKLVLETSVSSITKDAAVTVNTSQLPQGVYTIVAEGMDSKVFNKVIISR